MKWDDGDCARNQLEDDGGHHVAQGEDAEHEEVEREQEVDVFLAEDVEEDVESEEGTGSNNWEHHSIFLGHCLWSLSCFLLILCHYYYCPYLQAHASQLT